MATQEYLVELNEAIKQVSKASSAFYTTDSRSLKQLLYNTVKETSMPTYEDMNAPEVSVIIHEGFNKSSKSKHRGYWFWIDSENLFRRCGVETEEHHLHMITGERTFEVKIRTGKANLDRALLDIAYHQLIVRERALVDLLQMTDNLEGEEDSDSEWEQEWRKSWSGNERRQQRQWKEMRAELRSRLSTNIQHLSQSCQGKKKILPAKNNESCSPLSSLPDEVSLRILSFLDSYYETKTDFKSLSRFGTTSKQNHQLYNKVLYKKFSKKKNNMEKDVVVYFHSVDSLFDGFTQKDIVHIYA
ncbi:predicted protein [Chaetoceros tenuissimus]|uniref:F-box domain-containing protein n=1 Tax=Chaetoceros tenuissimus TaxID=426638 RepID=A0AAD3GZ77_9STRA|nr:predicted protein [Chaetoceros tenuissimus]